MDADLAIVAPSGLPDELRLLYCALVEDALAALRGDGYQHNDSGNRHLARERDAREAFAWFCADREDYGTAFVVIARALDLNVEAVRAEVRRRWEALKMGEPVTRSFTCASCRAAFDHHYPNGIGKPPTYCPACKAKRTSTREETPRPAKPSTALVPRETPKAAAPKTSTALVPREAAKPPAKNGGGQRPTLTRPAARVTLPATPDVEALLAELVRERAELDATITYLARHYGVNLEVEA